MKTLRRVTALVLLSALLLLLLPLVDPRLGLLLTRVPFAWVDYLCRTLPKVTLNWSAIGMVVLCSAIGLALVHSFCGWLFRQRVVRDKDSPAPNTWPVRWTFALYGGFWLLFAIVIGSSGVVRTTTWLFEFDQPLYRARRSYYYEMKIVDGMLATAALETKSDISAMRKWILEYDAGYRRGPAAWEEHVILSFPGASNKLHAAVYYPRDPEGQQRVGFRVFGGGSSQQEYTMDQLPGIISQLEEASRQAEAKRYGVAQ